MAARVAAGGPRPNSNPNPTCPNRSFSCTPNPNLSPNPSLNPCRSPDRRPGPKQVDLTPLDGFPLWERDVHDQLHACFAELSEVFAY